MIILLFLVPVVLISGVFYYLWQKKLLAALLASVFFAGVTALAMYFFAAVRTSYCGQNEWQQEREFFLRIFIQKLESSGDLKTAALAMQSEAVKEETLTCIQRIVASFYPKSILFLSAGSVVLLLAVTLLLCRKLAEKRYFPYFWTLLFLLGTLLFDAGIFYLQYASGTERQLKRFLYSQQTFLMKELAETKTDLYIPEIVKITLKEAERKDGYGYGQRLPELLRRKLKE
jgi:hypothetical protein